MIKIGNRMFVPLKIAANLVGYSVDWVRNCSGRYHFPKKIYYNGRVGYWLHQLERWKLRSVKQNRAA